MTTSAIKNGLRVIKILANQSQGVTYRQLMTELDISSITIKNLLLSMESRGFLRFDVQTKSYRLSLKLAKLGMAYVEHSGVSAVYQPLLEQLAQETGELVRITLKNGNRLIWVGMAKGSHKGLRVAPDTGSDVCLHATAAGKAWLSCMEHGKAIKLILDQGLVHSDRFGPKAIQAVNELLVELKKTERQGYAISIEEYLQGMSAIAVPIFSQNPSLGDAVGSISIAGPTVRMSKKRLKEMLPLLKKIGTELAMLSPIFTANVFPA